MIDGNYCGPISSVSSTLKDAVISDLPAHVIY